MPNVHVGGRGQSKKGRGKQRTETERGNWVLKNMRQHFRRHMSPVKLCASVCEEWVRKRQRERERARSRRCWLCIVLACVYVCVRVCVCAYECLWYLPHATSRQNIICRLVDLYTHTHAHTRTECCGQATCAYPSNSCAYISACILCFTRQRRRHTKQKEKKKLKKQQQIIVKIIKRKCGKYNACISREHSEEAERQRQREIDR